jgi:PhzF family phenazine biosynthesis protein
MSTALFTVDAFASEPFSGNPAAVVLLPRTRDEAWMQSVACEMNLSETAFVVARGADFDLRWFTPTVEVALCGHATLASAHVLWEAGKLGADQPARFHTQSGLLTCTRDGASVHMDFPSVAPLESAPPAELAQALGVPFHFAGKSRMDWLVEVASEEIVRRLRPDLALLQTLPVRGLIVTAKGTGEFDCVSRFFAPAAGVDEDPVTGSAHCTLAPYWGAKLGKQELVGWQASRRGGLVRMRLEGQRVILGGKAITISKGELVA